MARVGTAQESPAWAAMAWATTAWAARPATVRVAGTEATATWLSVDGVLFNVVRHHKMFSLQWCTGVLAYGVEAVADNGSRHHSTGSIKLNRTNGRIGSRGGGSTATTVAMGMQQEVYSKKGMMRWLMRWSRLRWDAAEQAECVMCL
ncbi:hypothetical protein ABZP36_014514 [Zizania latifolia]